MTILQNEWVLFSHFDLDPTLLLVQLSLTINEKDLAKNGHLHTQQLKVLHISLWPFLAWV